MITNLGKELRKLRLDLGITLYDMAKAIDVSSALLSSVETGKKPATKALMDKLAFAYQAVRNQRASFDQLAEETQKEVRIRIDNEDPESKELALVFARNFNTLDQHDVQRLLAVFSEKSNK